MNSDMQLSMLGPVIHCILSTPETQAGTFPTRPKEKEAEGGRVPFHVSMTPEPSGWWLSSEGAGSWVSAKARLVLEEMCMFMPSAASVVSEVETPSSVICRQ